MEQFLFKTFVPGNSLKSKADRALARILERTPSDAGLTAVLEKVGDNFRCAIEIGSCGYPIFVEASHKNPSIALDKAELAAIRKLDRWTGLKLKRIEEAPQRAPLRVAAS